MSQKMRKHDRYQAGLFGVMGLYMAYIVVTDVYSLRLPGYMYPVLVVLVAALLFASILLLRKFVLGRE